MTVSEQISNDVADLLDSMSDAEITSPLLVAHSSQIHAIAAIAKTHSLFRKASQKEDHEDLICWLQVERGGCRAVWAFEEFLAKVCQAPTTNHALAAAVIYMPVIASLLAENTNEK